MLHIHILHIKQFNKNDKCIQLHFKTEHLNEKEIKLKTIQNIKEQEVKIIIMILT